MNARVSFARKKGVLYASNKFENLLKCEKGRTMGCVDRAG
jgi:hypothetical protein